MNHAQIVQLLGNLQKQKRLKGPIIFDGHNISITSDTTKAAVAITPVYDVNGWASNTATILGGVRGKHTDEAIADIAAAGYQDLADYLPKYFCFLPNAALTADQTIQVQLNIGQKQNFDITSSPPGVVPVPGYHGEVTGTYPAYVPYEQTGFGPDGRTITFTRTPREAALVSNPFYHPQYHESTSIHVGGDHALLDNKWNTATDLDAARFIRHWAIAYGVNVNPEPTV